MMNFRFCLLHCLLFTSAVQAADRPNVLLICVDDLRPELNCYGASYIQSPNIDELASSGTLFSRHYVQAPTCGASRSAMLTGKYGDTSNHALFDRAAKIAAGQDVTPSMPAWFKQNGYATVSVGKVSHHPGGLGGPDWNDSAQPEMPNSWDKHLLPFGAWKHPRGWMHGLAAGEIRFKRADMDVFQSAIGDDSTYPDGPSIDESLRQLDALHQDQSRPFFLAVGILRPHLPFGAPAKYMDAYRDIALPPIAHPKKPAGKTTWHKSGEFMTYNLWGRNPNLDTEFADQVRRHYAACVSYSDAQVGKLIARLKQTGAWDNTIIVLWGDHGYHLGEHAIWGKHALFEESLHSPLIIRSPSIESVGTGSQPTKSDAIVESIDLFPTLCELAGLQMPEFSDGVSIVPILSSTDAPGHAAVSYFKNAQTIRTDTHRLVVHRGGHLELYDHSSDDSETTNVAKEYPEIARQLQDQLNQRLAN